MSHKPTAQLAPRWWCGPSTRETWPTSCGMRIKTERSSRNSMSWLWILLVSLYVRRHPMRHFPKTVVLLGKVISAQSVIVVYYKMPVGLWAYMYNVWHLCSYISVLHMKESYPCNLFRQRGQRDVPSRKRRIMIEHMCRSQACYRLRHGGCWHGCVSWWCVNVHLELCRDGTDWFGRGGHFMIS